MQSITSEASITLDGDGSGGIQMLVPETCFGGAVIRSDHVLENHGDSYILVNSTTEILEGGTMPISENEIISGVYTETGAQGTMTFGSGDDILSRVANTVDFQWQQVTTGAQFRSCDLVIKQNGDNWRKVVIDAWNGAINSAHWYSWQITGWSNSHTLTPGVRNDTSGIEIWNTGDSHLFISVLYENMPSQFSWYGNWSNNGAVQIHIPETADGVQFTEIPFPYLMAPHEQINFVWRLALDPLITPGEYSAEMTFVPEN